MKATTVGIDLAKNVFSVHGVDAHGKVVLKKTVSRGRLLEFFANLPRALRNLGHDARLIAQAARGDGNRKRLMTLPGIGPNTASALLACIGCGHDFKNGRPSGSGQVRKRDAQDDRLYSQSAIFLIDERSER